MALEKGSVSGRLRLSLHAVRRGPLTWLLNHSARLLSTTVSLAAAIDYIQQIGLNQIAAHEEDLLNHSIKYLQTVDGMTLYGSNNGHCGSVSFNLTDIHPYDVGVILDKMGIAVLTGTLCAGPVMQHYGISGALRASFSLYNTRDEVDRLITGLQKARQLLGK